MATRGDTSTGRPTQPHRGLWRDHPALMVAVTYGVIGLIYIALSDQVVSWLVHDKDRLTLIQTYKGWAFIIATTVVIFLLVRHSVNQMRIAQRERQVIDERYRQMIETTNEGVVVADADSRCQYVNRTFADMIGYSPGEILKKRCGECVSDEHRPMVERILADPNIDGPQRFDCELKHANGSTVWTIVSASPIIDPVTLRTATLFMVTDISARKQAERALEGNLEVQRDLLNELDHRVRNNLSSLAAIIDLSRGSADNVEDFARDIGGRVQAMAKAHALAGQAGTAGLDLRRVLEEMVPPHLRPRLTFDGPTMHAERQVVIPLAMLMHEMLERSEWQGALSTADGRVRVRWEAAGGAAADMTWSEAPPPPQTPASNAISRNAIIEGLVRSDLRGSIEPASNGYRMRLALRPPTSQGV